jgi:antitoxin (DNA-binding transcriptional repressor) of toxin-antitoxin stability system
VIARAVSGETVLVMRGALPVARIEAVARAPAIESGKLEPFDLDRLRKLTKNVTYQEVSADDLIRWMRDTDRY